MLILLLPLVIRKTSGKYSTNIKKEKGFCRYPAALILQSESKRFSM